MKTCSLCKQSKDINCFGKLSKSKDGLNGWCKDCKNAKQIAKRNEKMGGPSVRRINSQLILDNKQMCHKCKLPKDTSEFYSNKANKYGFHYECKSCAHEDAVIRYNDNKEEIKSNVKQHYQENKEKRQQYSRQYYYNNTETQKLKSKNYHKKRRSIDPAFKLRKNISTLISIIIRSNGSSKMGQSVLKYLSYTIQELKEHLENQFDDNMNWENYGSYWSLDHIYPQSKLPYTNMEEENFQKCWALSNLRPLEKIANIKKGNKIYGI